MAVALKSDGRCRYVSKQGTLGARRSCKTPVFLTASGTTKWRLDLQGRVPARDIRRKRSVARRRG